MSYNVEGDSNGPPLSDRHSPLNGANTNVASVQDDRDVDDVVRGEGEVDHGPVPICANADPTVLHSTRLLPESSRNLLEDGGDTSEEVTSPQPSLPLDCIIVANPVQPQVAVMEDGVNVDAFLDPEDENEELQRQEASSCRKRLVVIGLFVSCLGAIVAVLLKFARPEALKPMTPSGSKSPSEPPTQSRKDPTSPSPTYTSMPSQTPSSPTQSPTTQRARFVELIQSTLPSVSFEDSASPESRALSWMLSDDYSLNATLATDSNQILERFALATMW